MPPPMAVSPLLFSLSAKLTIIGKETMINDGGGGGDPAEEAKVAVDAAGASVEDLLRFLQFDVVQSPSDHHYLREMEQVRAANLVSFL